MSMKKSFGPHRWGIPCPLCVHSLGPLEDTTGPFFESGEVRCNNCGNSIDLWEAGKKAAALSMGAQMTVACVGATQTFFEFDLRVGEHKELDFATVGVPDGAMILGLAFTPHGRCFPLIWHGNNALVRFFGLKFVVCGIPMEMGGDEGSVTGLVTWVERGERAESLLYLTDAMEALSSRRFRHVILPAHIAFELEIMSLLRMVLERHASKDRVRDFVGGELRLADAVNVVVPLICGMGQIPEMPPGLRNALNHLRRLRNELVHEGLSDDFVTETLAGEMLFAAVFGIEYVRFMRRLLFHRTRSPQFGR